MATGINFTSTLTCMSEKSFWETVNILIKKPHVVNKRLWGSKTLFRDTCKRLIENWKLPFIFTRLKNSGSIESFKIELFQKLQVQKCCESVTAKSNLLEVLLIELLPKSYSDSHAYQLILLEKDNAVITFYDVTPEELDQKLCPDFSFSLQLDRNNITLKVECEITSKSYKWLKDTVLPQFIKWGEESVNKIETHICNDSLTLVSNDEYYKRYNDLKLKYGKEMVKIWPECTDPTKFVYEDVAIATYLLLLWDDEKKENNSLDKQTFVDLGCGNGLLVHILTEEGHHGVGLDVRKRQIWDMYSNEVKLEERTITPSDVSLFPDADWIIGNHSDELTPWIPVIAARSSYKCNFFLLPCCAFNFDGTKYQRRDSSKSQYNEYLQYIKQLCEDCGFRTKSDRLKIPSTKRICLVSKGRIYPEEEYDRYCNIIQDLINIGTTSSLDYSDQKAWINDFKPRDAVERVRNCTQIDKTLIESIVDSISSHLLEDCSLESSWSAGKTAEIAEVVLLISPDKLKVLKSECGGIQTLLKNNHHIFKVQSGKVQLRYPKTVEEVKNGRSKKNKYKATDFKIQQKPCWFYNNHPKGCPLKDANCSFLHVKSQA